MIFVFLDLAILCLLIGTLVYSFFKYRITVLHKLYFAFHVCVMFWPVGRLMMNIVAEPKLQYVFFAISFIAVFGIGYIWLWSALIMRCPELQTTFKRIAWSALPLVVCSVVMFLNPGDSLVTPIDGGYSDHSHGALLWIVCAIVSVYYLAAFAALVWPEPTGHAKRKQVQIRFFIAAMSIFAFFSIGSAIVHFFNFGRYMHGEFISLGMVLATVCYYESIRRRNAFQIIDFALHDVISNMSMGIIVIDTSDTVLIVNRTVKSFRQIAAGDILDIDRYMQLFHLQHPMEVEQFIHAWKTQPHSSHSVEVKFMHRGSALQLLIQVSPIMKDDVFLGRIITLQNVSELRIVISELNEKNDALRKKNEELIKMQQELAAANEKLEKAATTDPLTGCYNRRYLNQMLEDELRINLRYGIPFSILLFDIDLFKTINDTYGHQVGDIVLIETANIVRRTLRDSDILARYGGEEFTVYLPHTRRKDAIALGHRIRKAVESNVIPTPKGDVSVTISIGITGLHQTKADNDVKEILYALFSHADAALYSAKKSGRNQIVISD